MAGTGNQWISVQPEELKFQFELEKQSYCDLKVANTTEHHVAFKVKTTSPKKYFVRPNSGVIHPWDSCIVKVILQGQRESPPDMQCKDKFLLLSTIVPSNIDVDELPQDTFDKDGGKTIDECKLRVVYVSAAGNTEDEEAKGFKQRFDTSSNGPSGRFDDNQAIQQLKDERDAAVQRTQQLRQELETMKRRRNQRNGGFSFTFALFVGLIGIMAGLLFTLSLSSPSHLSSLPSTS